jgi:holin-like protein
MIPALTILLCCQLAGELLAQLFRLPVPGPVLGMLLLLALLLAHRASSRTVHDPAQALLRHLSLLFIPAGVGLVRHIAPLRAEWLAVSAAVLVSTALTIAVSALVFEAVSRSLERR